jgi:hypothetical protein
MALSAGKSVAGFEPVLLRSFFIRLMAALWVYKQAPIIIKVPVPALRA